MNQAAEELCTSNAIFSAGNGTAGPGMGPPGRQRDRRAGNGTAGAGMGPPGREWDRHLGGVPDGGVFPPTNDPWTVGPQGTITCEWALVHSVSFNK